MIGTINKPKVLTSIIAVGMMIFFASTALAGSDVLTLRLGHVVTQVGGEHLGSVKFAELLDKKSGGKIKLLIYPNAQMGGNREMLESLQFGALDISLPALPALGGFTDKTKVFDLLYLFNNRKEAEKILDGPIGKEIAKAVESADIKIISWWSQGFREMTSNRHIRSLKDLRGVKIRVMENPLHIEGWNTLGASAIPMAFSEVLTSLQQGVLDAQENPYQNIKNSGFHRVQKYIIETSHLYGPLPVVFSKVNWGKLTSKQQAIIMEAVEETKIWQREKQEEINSQIKKDILSEGNNAIIELSADQKQKFRKKIIPLYTKHAPSMNGILEKIYSELGRKIDF